MASSAVGMKRANQCGQSSFCGPTIGRSGFYSSLPPLHCCSCTPEKSAIDSHKFNETADFQNPRAAAANSQVGHCSLLQSLSVHSTLTYFYIICLSDRKWIQYFPECFVCNTIFGIYQKRITLTAISAEGQKVIYSSICVQVVLLWQAA